MQRVTGIGGIFFKANDPQALADWYGRHLGLDVPTGWAGALLPWKRADTGADALTVWSPFAADTRYFEPGDKPYMLNFRVDDLDAMLAAITDRTRLIFVCNPNNPTSTVVEPDEALTIAASRRVRPWPAMACSPKM